MPVPVSLMGQTITAADGGRPRWRVGSVGASMVTVLMPLPACDFDPTEVAVSWQVLSDAGHEVRFATPSGQPGRADDLMVTGRGLDPWGAIPGLRRVTVVGRVLRADKVARQAYASLLSDEAFGSPLHWGAARRSEYDALLLPGGHRARGMRAYLESPEVQQMTTESFRAGKPVGAICHGVLVAARATDPKTGHSVLHGRRTTALTWSLERKAWDVARYTRSGTPTITAPTWRSPGNPRGTCRCSRR